MEAARRGMMGAAMRAAPPSLPTAEAGNGGGGGSTLGAAISARCAIAALK